MAMAAPSPSLSCGFSISHGPIKLGTKNNDQFPAGLRVLVVDDDPICLLILDRLLRECRYEVTTCGKATTALKMLREGRNRFDVVISDVVMPDMDGFKLLELVGLEMDLPVIMMSVNGETSAVMKGITHGACDYLLKPVRIEELRNIWQHVVRKKQRGSDLAPASQEERNRSRIHDGDPNSSANDDLDGSWKFSKKRKDVRDEEEDTTEQDNEDPSSSKRPRVVWSVDLHQQFVGAVNQLGIEKAVPKRILELMNVPGLTRENVASHLQKYRLYLKRISNATHHSGSSFAGTLDMSFGGGIGQSSNDIGLDMTCVDPSLFLHLAAMQDARGGGLMRPSYVQSLLYQGAGSLHQGLAPGLNPKQLGQQPQPVITFGEMGNGQTGTLASQGVSVAAGLVGIEQPPRFSNTAPGNSTNYALVSRTIQQQPGSELANANVPSCQFFGQLMVSNNLGGTRDALSSSTPTRSGFDIARTVGQVRPRYGSSSPGGKVSVSVVGEVSDCASPSTRRMDLNVSRLMRSEDQSKLSTRKRDGRQDSKLGQRVEEFCTSISSPQLTKSVSSGQMLNMGSMQEPAQNVISLSSLAIDSCHLKAFMHNNVSQEDLMVVDELKEKDASLGLSRGLKVESSFFQESLYSSDELLNSFWKQQQEGLVLVEDLGMNYSALDETSGNRRNSAWGSLKKEA